MLMMGDNVYASKPELQPISEQYQKLHLIPEYRALRESIPVMATWDDHDYGLNDGGADNPLKEEAKKEFLKEFSYVRDATTNSQPGLYHSKILGDKKRQVQIIMLDTRWNRSELTKAPDYGPSQRYYSPNNDAKATILGEKQWQWLAQELKKPASLKIIVSSIQVLGENQRYEKWANFPREKARLLELIRSSGNRNVVLFSGDRHIGVISQEKLKNFGTLYEATSSSLNSPTDFAETDPSYLGPIYGKVNYGLMKIDWVSRKARIEIRGINGEVAQAVDIKLH
jgi:alkaline phosphatase D